MQIIAQCKRNLFIVSYNRKCCQRPVAVKQVAFIYVLLTISILNKPILTFIKKRRGVNSLIQALGTLIWKSSYAPACPAHNEQDITETGNFYTQIKQPHTRLPKFVLRYKELFTLLCHFRIFFCAKVTFIFVFHFLQRYKILRFPLYRGTKKIEKIFLLQKNRGLKRTNPILVEAIARRMLEIREQNGHTQEYLAHNTHLKIWDYESMQKSPSLESIARFCTFYALSLSDFFAPITFPQDLK